MKSKSLKATIEGFKAQLKNANCINPYSNEIPENSRLEKSINAFSFECGRILASVDKPRRDRIKAERK